MISYQKADPMIICWHLELNQDRCLEDWNARSDLTGVIGSQSYLYLFYWHLGDRFQIWNKINKGNPDIEQVHIFL